jgi:hypothetical protein
MTVFIRYFIESLVPELRSSDHNYCERALILVLTYAATFNGSEF